MVEGCLASDKCSRVVTEYKYGRDPRNDLGKVTELDWLYGFFLFCKNCILVVSTQARTFQSHPPLQTEVYESKKWKRMKSSSSVKHF